MITLNDKNIYCVEGIGNTPYDNRMKISTFTGGVLSFQNLLEKIEYYIYYQTNFLGEIYLNKLKFKFRGPSLRLDFVGHYNLFGCDTHYRTLTLNLNIKVRKNCGDYPGVAIKVANVKVLSAKFADSVDIASGLQIIEPAIISNGITIESNAIIVRDIDETNIKVRGIIARKNNNNSEWNLLTDRGIINRGNVK